MHRDPLDPLDGGPKASDAGPKASDAGQPADTGQQADVGTTACPTGTKRCGDDCVDIFSDPDHCGGCGSVCQETLCVEGACEIPPDCKKSGEACSGKQCCEGLTCGYYGSSLACKPPDA